MNNNLVLLTLENVLVSEIQTRLHVVYGPQNVITKLSVNQRVQRFNVGQMSASD